MDRTFVRIRRRAGGIKGVCSVTGVSSWYMYVFAGKDGYGSDAELRNRASRVNRRASAWSTDRPGGASHECSV